MYYNKDNTIFAQNIPMNKKEIGKAIIAHMKQTKQTKYRVVKNTGLTFQQLKSIDTGATNYTIDTLATYLNAIGLELKTDKIK